MSGKSAPPTRDDLNVGGSTAIPPKPSPSEGSKKPSSLIQQGATEDGRMPRSWGEEPRDKPPVLRPIKDKTQDTDLTVATEPNGRPGLSAGVKIAIVIATVFVSIAFLSGLLGLVGGTSFSYDVGFDTGTVYYHQVIYFDSPEDYCRMIVDMSKGGTPTDNIDWASVDSAEFIRGCVDGYNSTQGD